MWRALRLFMADNEFTLKILCLAAHGITAPPQGNRLVVHGENIWETIYSEFLLKVPAAIVNLSLYFRVIGSTASPKDFAKIYPISFHIIEKGVVPYNTFSNPTNRPLPLLLQKLL